MNQTSDALALYREVAADLIVPTSSFALSQPGDATTRRIAGTHKSLFAIIDGACAANADRPLFDFDGAVSSYGEVAAEADRLAAGLRDAHAIKRGDVVGIVMRNCKQWFVCYFALQRLGAVAALLNSRGTGAEVAASAADVGAKLILAGERSAQRLEGVTPTPVLDPDAIASLIARSAPLAEDERGSGEDAAMILFTSGTTGRAKGATISHRNICCAARQLAYMVELGITIAARRRGIPVEVVRKHAPPPVPLLIVPMFHISGITQMLTTMQGGGLMAGMRRWDAAVALDMIERDRVTQVSGPSLVMADLLDQPNATARMATVTSLVVAGQASPIALTDRIRRELPQAGQAAGWGMTELSGTVASCSGSVFLDHPGKIGVPLPLVDITLRGPDGEDVPRGSVGEICVRGPTVMKGYWGNQSATAASFDGEWFLTGDLGAFDEDGLLSIVDRAKDMVISAGENIYCAEVERVLAMVPHHQEVALFGVADERLGERAVAAIVFSAQADRSPDAGVVRAHAREHLAEYKVPTEIVFDLGPLPRNVTGKIDKAELRRRYASRATAPAA